MTGEHQNRDDEHEEIEDLGDDDGSFVLEDWDELDQVLAEVEHEVGKRSEDRDLGEADPENQLYVVDDDLAAAELADEEIESPEDLLFRPTLSRSHEPTFSETAQTEWAGESLDAEAIGIPVEAPVGHEIGADEASLLEGDDEVQEVDLDVGEDLDFRGESGFFRAEGKGADAKWESAGEQEEIPAESQEFVGPDGGEDWAPYDPATAEQEVEAEAVEEVEGDEIHVANEVGFAGHDASNEAEYAEQYAQSDWAPARVRRRGIALRIAGAAALLLVAAGVGTVLYRPEWLGLKPPTVVVDRTEVARPKLELALAAPSHDLGAVAEGEGGAGDPLLAGGEPEPLPTPMGDPVQIDPQPEATPPDLPPVASGEGGESGARPGSEPVNPGTVDLGAEPGEEGLVVIDGGVRATDKAAPAQRDLVAVGDELRVGGEVAAPSTEPAPVHAMAAGLIVGDHAYAQLINGNFFVGNVKRFDSDVVTLRVANGEITIPFAEIRGFGSVDSPKYRELMRSQPGFIKLNNTNRLKGSIVLGSDGDVTLGVDTSRIVIPKTEVKEVNESLPSGIRIEEDSNDDEWIQQLIERRLEKRRAAEEERGREGSKQESFTKEQQLPQPPK